MHSPKKKYRLLLLYSNSVARYLMDKAPPDFEAMMDRIQLMTGCRTQNKLAEFLGTRQSSISAAKKRESIPSDWLLVLWRKKGVNPDWIVTGEGSKEFEHTEIQEGALTEGNCTQAVRPLEDCPTEELMTEVIRRVAKMWKNGMREV